VEGRKAYRCEVSIEEHYVTLKGSWSSSSATITARKRMEARKLRATCVETRFI